MKQIRQNHVLNNEEKTELLNIVNDVGERLVPGIVHIYDYLTHLSRYVFFSKIYKQRRNRARCSMWYWLWILLYRR